MIHSFKKILDFDAFHKENVDIKNTFSQKEIDLYYNKKNAGSIVARYALKVILKENVFNDYRFDKVEILNNEFGKPYLNFLEESFEINLYQKGILKLDFSLSHSKKNAIALLVIEKHDV